MDVVLSGQTKKAEDCMAVHHVVRIREQIRRKRDAAQPGFSDGRLDPLPSKTRMGVFDGLPRPGFSGLWVARPYPS